MTESARKVEARLRARRDAVLKGCGQTSAVASMRVGIIDIFSKRKKRAASGSADVYKYDDLPEKLRVQVALLWREGFGPYWEPERYRSGSLAFESYRTLHDALRKEYGYFQLPGKPYDTFEARCVNFLMQGDTDEALDIIELSFRIMQQLPTDGSVRYHHPDADVDRIPNVIDELNGRFRENSVGYQFEDGLIIRVDSAILHAEAVRPALRLLRDEKFEGADEEFRSAFEHYRHGRLKEALNDALKAFESTMKTICKRKRWTVPDNATAKTLIAAMFDKGLIPKWLETHFSGIRMALEAGVPTTRNKVGGHGQGAKPVEVQPFLAAYTLHLAASNIVLLVEAYRVIK